MVEKSVSITRKIILLSFLIVSMVYTELKSCTTVIAGRNTTKDGSILFAKAEDDNDQLDYYWHIDRKIHDKNSFVLETSGLKIPQVAETYAYFWGQSPKTMFSNVVINEWGVALGSNGCNSKEDSAEKLEELGILVDGGIGFRLRFILAERSKTAREAVLLAAELINKYGYNASGRSLNIVGPNEAWQLQLVRGKHFVARRVQDDEVVILANTFTIRTVDIDDTDNFICSPDIVDYAIQRDWFNPKTDGEFDFAKAYATDKYHKSGRNTHRTWILAKLLQKDFSLTVSDAENGEMPVSVKPDKKLTVQDMIDIFRNHYETTKLCEYLDKNISPHYINNKPICNRSTHKVIIIQQRNWLPKEIGTVYWRALSHPCQSVFVPWYLGINKIPQKYKMGYEDPNTSDKKLLQYHFEGPDWQIRDMDLNSASSVFQMLNSIGDSDYAKKHLIIREVFDKMELKLLEEQPDIDKKALDFYKIDKRKAINYLTNYTNSKAMSSFELAKNIIIDFLKE